MSKPSNPRVKSKIVPLTPAQVEDCKAFMEKARAADAEGKPGMVIAQIFGDHMRVGFVAEERAVQISRISGGKGMIRTAFDRDEQDEDA